MGKCECKMTPGYGHDIKDQPKCDKCNPSCNFCINNDFEGCTSCPKNKHKVHVSNNKYKCVPDEGYFCNHCLPGVKEPSVFPEPGIKCDISCKTCSGTKSN